MGMKSNYFLMAVAAVAVGCSSPKVDRPAEKTPRAVSFRAPEIIPAVKSIDYQADVEVRLDKSQTLTVRCPDAAATDWVRDHAKQWFGFSPSVVAGTPPAGGAAEGYRLVAKPDGIAIEAASLQGVRYAMFALRQVAERDSCGDTVKEFRLPALTIEDEPVLAFRGIHLCWLPELSADLIEREIRAAAFYRFNVVVLESWGVFRSERHPWFGWRNGPMTKAVVRHLVEVARDLGVTLVPQLNVFGHASASRSCVGKHATLDFGPERQPLFEPGCDGGMDPSVNSGWNWCLSNPAAVETVRDLVVEMHEAFGNPPYFHIGCDEADAPTCASCRAAPYAELVCRHITGVSELLKSRGARAMMWHDMLIKRGDPRWKGFYANGSDETARLPSMLPKDVIVCDWYYGSDPGGTQSEGGRTSVTNAYPTLEYFSKTCGFDTLTCPWEESNGTRAQTKYARENGLFGVLETTWHHFGGMRFPKMVQTSACGAWGRGEKRSYGHFATLWRQCGWDMGRQSYSLSGWNDTQVTRDILER